MDFLEFLGEDIFLKKKTSRTSVTMHAHEVMLQ